MAGVKRGHLDEPGGVECFLIVLLFASALGVHKYMEALRKLRASSICPVGWRHAWGAVPWLVGTLTVTGIPPVNNLTGHNWMLTEKLACQIAKGQVAEMLAESTSQWYLRWP